MRALTVAIAGLLAMASTALAGPTLDSVKARGQLNCGVNTGLIGFSAQDAGRWSGLDVDICRAVAAAVLGDPAKVRYMPLSAQARFEALRRGQVDLLARNTTLTLTADALLGFDFGPVVYYDGQGFMLPKRTGADNINKLPGVTVCVQQGTTSEANLVEYSARRGLNLKPMPFPDLMSAESSYFAGRCAAYTADRSALAASRARRPAQAAEHVVLEATISREPLAPLMRQGDPAWSDLVRWTVYALIAADEYDITAASVPQNKTNTVAEVRRLLGVEPGIGQAFGLDDEWAARAIAAVGSYSEMFDRNVGAKSALKLEQGPNQLWSRGGLMYAPPFR